jgi:hypothetical protein
VRRNCGVNEAFHVELVIFEAAADVFAVAAGRLKAVASSGGASREKLMLIPLRERSISEPAALSSLKSASLPRFAMTDLLVN